MESEPILKKTLLTMATMVGVSIAFVGTLSITAVLVTNHAVGGGNAPTHEEEATASPASHPTSPTSPAGRAPKFPLNGQKMHEQI